MKNLVIVSLFISASLFMVLLPSCKDKCTNCPPRSECVKGVCTCEEGGFMFNNNCVQLDENSYIGINSDCYCYDTLIISFGGSGEYRQMAMPIKYGDQVGSLTQGIFYYELSSGDSIYSPQLDLRCFNENDIPLKPAAYGKKQADGSWKIRLEFQDAITFEVIDNCTMVLNPFK